MPRGAPLGESISASLVAIAAVVILSRRPEPWQQVGLIDLLAGWTVIGWVVALVLAFSLPRPGSPPPGLVLRRQR